LLVIIHGVEEPAASEENEEDASATNSGAKPTTRAQPRFAVLDALSATGLRALRYTLELPMVTSATANDLDPSAVDSIRRNIEYNKQHSTTTDPDKMSAAEAVCKIKPSLGNAQHHMYSVLSPAHHNLPTREPQSLKYEVIDLDPYGTAAIFLDAAVQAVSNGGLLCVTCTDAGVWASTGYSEKCYSLYGGTPVKGEWCHEAGLRLILHSIASAAGKYGLYIEPLLSLSIDFYARVWVRIRHGPAEVKKLASSTMIVYNCDEGCGSWVTQILGKAREKANKSGSGTFLKFGLARAPTVGENCAECGSVMHVRVPKPKSPWLRVDLFLLSSEVPCGLALYTLPPLLNDSCQSFHLLTIPCMGQFRGSPVCCKRRFRRSPFPTAPSSMFLLSCPKPFVAKHRPTQDYVVPLLDWDIKLLARIANPIPSKLMPRTAWFGKS